MGEVTMKANVETELSGEDAVKMQKLIDALESLDDVQEVYTRPSWTSEHPGQTEEAGVSRLFSCLSSADPCMSN
jgi:hypothetical protein